MQVWPVDPLMNDRRFKQRPYWFTGLILLKCLDPFLHTCSHPLKIEESHQSSKLYVSFNAKEVSVLR